MAKKTETNPLVGNEVWTLTIVNDYGVSETSVSIYTSFRKALNAARLEFKEHDLMDYWEKAKKELKEQWFFRDAQLFNGDRFLIDCHLIA